MSKPRANLPKPQIKTVVFVTGAPRTRPLYTAVNSTVPDGRVIGIESEDFLSWTSTGKLPRYFEKIQDEGIDIYLIFLKRINEDPKFSYALGEAVEELQYYCKNVAASFQAETDEIDHFKTDIKHLLEIWTQS